LILSSIRYRFAGAIILIEVVMLSVLLWSTLSLIEHTYRDRLDDSAGNIARQFAATAGRYVFEADIPSLAEYATQVARHEELAYIRVFDRMDRLIYEFSALETGATPAETFEVTEPIELAGQSLGRADLGFSLKLMKAAVTQARIRGIAIASLEVLLSILAALWVGARLTRDLRALSNAAERYGAGEVDVSVAIDNDTEVGRTARAFNHMVEARKHTDEALRQSSKMEAIGNLTGGVAHDFNNLLAVILGNLELSQQVEDDEERAELINEAIDATQRGADLTRNMLAFARRAPLEPAILDLNRVVRDTKNWSARVLPETISVETSLLAGLWPIRADPASTQNAILNLMLNARDAMQQGGKLTIETTNVRIDDDYLEARGEDLEPGRHVMLAVSDTGEGIAPELMERVFDPFFTTKAPGQGSGLGLSMIQGFMKQSGGTVRVYSELGVGTTFKLYFKAESQDTLVDVRRQRGRDTQPRSGARILLVEDEQAVMDMLARTLRTKGYDVVEAASGDAAIKVFHDAEAFDLLLTDIVMPGLIQGPELAKRLRAIDPELPAVFMSGYANEATVHGNGLRPEDIRLMKPVKQTDLIKAIEKSVRAQPKTK